MSEVGNGLGVEVSASADRTAGRSTLRTGMIAVSVVLVINLAIISCVMRKGHENGVASI